MKKIIKFVSKYKSSGNFHCICHTFTGKLKQECVMGIALDDDIPRFCPFDRGLSQWTEIKKMEDNP